LRVSIVLPTFEPGFSGDPALAEFYRRNFDSWLDPLGGHDWSMVISDFRSAPAFKRVLRDYATSRGPRVVLFDGEDPLSSFQAFNVALRRRDWDVAVWAASDTRPRDRRWLSQLMADFADPEVLAVVPTVTMDGAAVLPQTQPRPIDRESEPIRPPRAFQLVTAAFHRRLLAPFGNRLADRFTAMGNDKGVMWQVIAAGGQARLNYRCNILHERFHGGGRHRWNDDPGRSDRRRVEQAAAKAVARFLPLPGGWFRHAPAWRRALAEGWRDGGWYGLARSAWIRWHYIQIRYALVMIRQNRAHMSYIAENVAFGRRLREFRALDRESRIRLVEALFMGGADVYERAHFETVSADERTPAAGVG
jgi:hypothetical protein